MKKGRMARGFGKHLTVRECLWSLLFLAHLHSAEDEIEVSVTPQSFLVIPGGNCTIRAECKMEQGGKVTWEMVHRVSWSKMNGSQVICELSQQGTVTTYPMYRERANCSKQGNAAVINLINLNADDVGDYEFKVILQHRGIIGRGTFTGRLYEAVLKPSIETQLENTVEVGKKLTLTCRVGAGTDPKFNWTVKEERVENNGSNKYLVSADGRVLTIEGMNRSDCLVYTCKVCNEHNCEEVHFNASAFGNLTLCQEVETNPSCVLIIVVVIVVPVVIGVIVLVGVLVWPSNKCQGGTGRTDDAIPMTQISGLAEDQGANASERDSAETGPSAQLIPAEQSDPSTPVAEAHSMESTPLTEHAHSD